MSPKKENFIMSKKDEIEAVAGLAAALPVNQIYEDAIQPAAKQIGKGLEIVTKTTMICLAPLKATVWGYEKIEDWVANQVAPKLEGVEKEKIQTPDLAVAGPTIDALRYAGGNEQIADLYAELLAKAMNLDTREHARTSFVEKIKCLNAIDVEIIKILAKDYSVPVSRLGISVGGGKAYPVQGFSLTFRSLEYWKRHPQTNLITLFEHVSISMSNLENLGLVEEIYGSWLVRDGAISAYEVDSASFEARAIMEAYQKIDIFAGHEMNYERGVLRLTPLGKSFVKTVLPAPHTSTSSTNLAFS